MSEENPETLETPETPSDSQPPAATEQPSSEQLEKMSRSLQRVQQELSQIKRKISNDGELSAVDKAKHEAAMRESAQLHEELQRYVKASEGDEGIDAKTAKAVLQLAEENRILREKQVQLESRLSDDDEPPDTEEVWATIEKEHGKGAREVWENVIAEVLKTSSTVKKAHTKLEAGTITQADYDEILQGVATPLFRERCKGLKKTPETPAVPTATPRPPKPPGGRPSVPMKGAQPAALTTDPKSQTILDRLSY